MRLNPFVKRSRPRRSPKPIVSEGWLKQETKQAVFGVILVVLAVILVFSFFEQAGRVGAALLVGLYRVVGWLSYAVPFVLAYVGYRLLRPNLDPLARWRLVGAALIAVGLLGIFHIVGVPIDLSLQVAAEGKGGGYVGFLLSYPLSLALSRVVAGIIFVASLLVGLFMTFNVSPAEVWVKLRGILMGNARLGAEEQGEEANEEESDESTSLISPFHLRDLRRQKVDATQLKFEEQAQQDKEKESQKARRNHVKAVNRRYKPPPLELLATSTHQANGGNVEENKQIIMRTLEHFSISVEMGKAEIGPTVTQYTLRPEDGVRLSQITALQNDLARALKAHPVRIEAPIPNTDLVGIEIPNKKVALVRLRDLMSAKEVRQAESPLTLALGKDVSGKVVAADLDRMPHLLIAGATNSGKSVCIHSILMSLLYHNSPQLLRLVLVDPKRVELTAYNGIPQLWGEKVIVDTNKTLNALKWALKEMDHRYKLLEEAGARNIMSYNLSNTDEPLPYVVIVVDELADLMAKHAREVEGPIVRLAQLARAVGIHLVLATQRPSVNVITGLIKANVPTRIAFKVASQVDSRTIIDMSGAEKLVGTGDMLYLASDNTKPRRLQGGFVSEEEVRQVVSYVVENNEQHEFDDDESITRVDLASNAGGNGEGDDDVLLDDAKEVARVAGKVSASLLQRRLRVGYARAARILDMLEEQGIIGAAEGNKPREVLDTGEEETAYSGKVYDEPDDSLDRTSDSEELL